MPIFDKKHKHTSKHKQDNVKRIKKDSTFDYHPSNVQCYLLSNIKEFIADKNFTYIESKWDREDIFIAPVAMLANNDQKIWGVFTTSNIKKGDKLGAYLGEKVTHSIKQNNINLDYFYRVTQLNDEDENVEGIDALKQRNWPALVNGTTPNFANVFAEVNEQNEIIYIANKNIKPGEQFLLSYGEHYCFPNKRYIKPQDNWSDSTDFLDRFQYSNELHEFPAFLSSHLGLEEGIWNYRAAGNESLIKNETVDLPVIFFNGSNIINQHNSDNLSSLMLACWQGDLTKIDSLLENGANINYQSSISGETPLHFILSTPHLNNTSKQVLLEKFIRKGADITIRNKFNHCVPMALIENKELDDIEKQNFLDIFLLPGIMKKNIQLISEDKKFIPLGAYLLLIISESKNLPSSLKIKYIDCLLKRGISADIRDEEGDGLLNLVIFSQDTAVVDFLLNSKHISVFLRQINRDGFCVILSAMYTGNIEIIRRLLPYTLIDDVSRFVSYEISNPINIVLLALRDDQTLTYQEKKLAISVIINFFLRMQYKSSSLHKTEKINLAKLIEDLSVFRDQHFNQDLSNEDLAVFEADCESQDDSVVQCANILCSFNKSMVSDSPISSSPVSNTQDTPTLPLIIMEIDKEVNALVEYKQPNLETTKIQNKVDLCTSVGAPIPVIERKPKAYSSIFTIPNLETTNIQNKVDLCTSVGAPIPVIPDKPKANSSLFTIPTIRNYPLSNIVHFNQSLT